MVFGAGFYNQNHALLSVDFIQEFSNRGLLAQVSHPEKLSALAQKESISAYIGFDPTASSFHAGHLIPLMALHHLQKAGHRPILLMGGGTARVGDPTGKNEMRKMLSSEELKHNTLCLKNQLKSFINLSSEALMLDNAEWLGSLGYLDFLREVGVHFSVNRLLAFETFKKRIADNGLSFLEFNYPLLQAYDFLELHKRHGCVLQLGGEDQWTNILAGVELIRRVEGKEVFALTLKLLTLSSGAKMGKTEKGTIWLDPKKTTPYEYYQYWKNIPDTDVCHLLRLLTQVSLEEIEKLEKLEGAEMRQAKELLAFEATKFLHGEEEAKKAQQAAQSVFSAGKTQADPSHLPTSQVSKESLKEGKTLPDILFELQLLSSKSEARRLIKQGGVHINQEKVENETQPFTSELFQGGVLLLRLGKKRFYRLELI